MKKRLSLLMVLMMIVSLLPMSAFAAFKAPVPNTIKVKTSDVTATTTVNLPVEFIGADPGIENQTFRIQLTEGAELTAVTGTIDAGAGAGTITPKALGEGLYEMEIAGAITNTSATAITLTLTANVEDANEGKTSQLVFSQNQRVGDTNAGTFMLGEPANVNVFQIEGAADSRALAITVSDSEKTMSYDGGTLSRFEIKNIPVGTTSIELEADKGLSWALDTTSPTFADTTLLGGAGVTSVVNNGNKVTIGFGATAAGASLVVVPKFGGAGSKASEGNVTVYAESLGGVNNPTTNSATIGKLVDFGVTMTVVEKNKKEIPNLWGGEEATVKVTLKGPKGSISNRDIDFKVDGADVRYGVNGSIVGGVATSAAPSKYTQLKPAPGASLTTAINGDPKAAIVVADGAKETVFKNKEFTITKVSGTNGFEDYDEFSFEIQIATDGDKDGVATITASQRGWEATADLAKVTPKFAAKADVTPIKKGEAKDAATVTITEAKAGLIQKGETITLKFDTKRNYVEHTTKSIKVEATNGMKFDTSSTGIAYIKDGNDIIGLSILVDRASTGEPAVITVSGLNVAVDGSTTDDVVKLDAGLKEKTNSNKVNTEYTVSSPDYIKVVKEYDMESILSVFTIGQTAYTVNGETKAAHSAPYIKAGRTMLPIRAVAESLGLTVQWNSATRTASFTDASKVAAVTIGGKVMYVNGTPMPLTVPAELVNDTTFVELRSLATAFGVQIDWDAAAKTATVSK